MSPPSISALFLQHILQDQSPHSTIHHPRVVHFCSDSASCTSVPYSVLSPVEICLSFLVTITSMAEEIRYVTRNGQPPNGGVPPGRLLASFTFGLPAPNPGNHALPPPYVAPNPPFIPTVHPEPPQPVAPAAPVTWTSPVRDWNPPGQYVDGCIMQGNGWTMIMPREITRFYFLWDGTRPCDSHRGYYSKPFNVVEHRAISAMTVWDLMDGLGMPFQDHYGIQEMENLGENRYASGLTVTRGSQHASKTLAEVGWSARRSEHRPIWLLVKK